MEVEAQAQASHPPVVRSSESLRQRQRDRLSPRGRFATLNNLSTTITEVERQPSNKVPSLSFPKPRVTGRESHTNRKKLMQESSRNDNNAYRRVKREVEDGKGSVAPDGVLLVGKVDSLPLLRLEMGEKIYLRPSIRPANQRYPQPSFVFPTTPPDTAGPDTPAFRSEEDPSHGDRRGRAHSCSTVDDQHAHVTDQDAGAFKVVIERPGTGNAIQKLDFFQGTPALDVPIPSLGFAAPYANPSSAPFGRISPPPGAATGQPISNDPSRLMPSPRIVKPLRAIGPEIFDALTFKPACDHPSIVRYGENGNIRAATPARLVAEITSPTFVDYDLLSDFFLTFRSFLATTDLLLMLIARLQWAVARFPLKIVEELKKCWRRRLGESPVLEILLWTQHFGETLPAGPPRLDGIIEPDFIENDTLMVEGRNFFADVSRAGYVDSVVAYNPTRPNTRDGGDDLEPPLISHKHNAAPASPTLCEIAGRNQNLHRLYKSARQSLPARTSFVDVIAPSTPAEFGRETTVFPRPPPNQKGPSAMSGPGMKRLLGSVRRALSTRAGHSPTSSPTQGSFPNIPPLGVRGATINRLPGTAVVPQARRHDSFRAPMRIDLLCLQVTKSEVSNGSKSILIVDDTMSSPLPMMTGALAASPSVGSFADHFLRPSHGPTPPTTPPGALFPGAPTTIIQSTGTYRESQSERSFDATTFTEEQSIAESSSRNAPAPRPLRVLRRRPGGDLRAVGNVGELTNAMPRPMSTGSITTYSDSVRSSYLLGSGDDSQYVDVVNSDYDEAQTHAETFSLGALAEASPKVRVSLFDTHSSQPVMRPSFEKEAQMLAQIPDDTDDDGGVESALLKLEGKFEQRRSEILGGELFRAFENEANTNSFGGSPYDVSTLTLDDDDDDGEAEKRRHRQRNVDSRIFDLTPATYQPQRASTSSEHRPATYQPTGTPRTFLITWLEWSDRFIH
ncbi:hypothetical protein DID88_000567 [Monilinia fructigena]|uniref:N-terminal Ras-GEF domain-containing protein n=1 Tax=Monilinia fructigena TaxID=38457 RepID=A0A395IIC8_9HELO|nr:hypothetical protein DID88_000567 [Monilinia fructigena]